MSADPADFLRRIAEHPESDAARLVYADWLDEHGHPDRAEFVRVQVELAHRPDGDPDLPRLHRTANRLWLDRDRESPVWRPPFAVPDGCEFGDPVRGFVDEIIGRDAAAFRAVSRELIETSPVRTLRLVRLTEPAKLAGCDELTPFRRLKLIRAGATADALRRLLDSPYLPNLAVLDLDGNRLTAEAVVAIARSPLAGQLRELWLGKNQLGDDGAMAIAGAASLGGLDKLDLSRNGIGDAAAGELAAARHLRPSLLDLRGNDPFGRRTRDALRVRFGDAVRL